MSLEITTLGTDTIEWDTFVRLSTEGTPFHLTAWKQTIERAFGFSPHYLVARRDGVVEGVLPLFEMRRLLRRPTLVSVPYAPYGGICAETAEARQTLGAAAAEVAQRRGTRCVDLRHKALARPISTDGDANARAIPARQRQFVLQGARYGLRATYGLQYLDRVYDVYARSVRDRAAARAPRRLFHTIAEVFGKECEVLAVWHDERIVAGVLTLLYEDQVVPCYGAALPERHIHGAADFMYWELMCHAARSGYQHILSDGQRLPDVTA